MIGPPISASADPPAAAIAISAALPGSPPSSGTPPAGAPAGADAAQVRTSSGARAAVAAEKGRGRSVDAAHVLGVRVQLDPRNERGKLLVRAAGRNRGQNICLDHLLALRALHVDDRGLPRNRDCFGE